MISSYYDLPRRSICIDDIDINDIRYKISKNRIQDSLLSSIQTWGILEDPVVIPENSRFIVLSGHNRLHVLRNAGIHETNCRIAPAFDLDSFLQAAELKFIRGEIGPMGRLKLLVIACEKAPHRIDDMIRMLFREFNVPEFIGRDENVMRKATELPQNLADYSDSRDISFKALRDLILLPAEAMGILSSWVDCINFRVNIFRDIVELLDDLSKRDGALELVRDIHLTDLEDPRGRENHVLGVLKELRYPEYAKRRKRAENLISVLRGKGAVVDFPQYFEGDAVGISFRITKRDGAGGLKNKLDNMDLQMVQELLDLL